MENSEKLVKKPVVYINSVNNIPIRQVTVTMVNGNESLTLK